MKTTRVVLIVLAFLLLAAHFSRAGSNVLAGVSLIFPLMLLVRKPWAGWTLRIALVLGGLEWLRTLVRLTSQRRGTGDEWVRMAVILGTVALVTLLAALAVRVLPPALDQDAPDE
jgi:hypothetical protein